MDFYDAFAGEYDAVVDAAARVEAVNAFAAKLLDDYHVTSALDVACGNGAFALALAARGVRVTGADASEAMIDQARARAAEAGLQVDWRCGPMQAIAEAAPGPFDAVLCMGNSLPHVLADNELAQTLGGFADIVADHGVVIVQLLNYGRVLACGERVVGVTRSGPTEYVRFYDFLGRLVRFNLLEIHWPDAPPQTRLHSTVLRPYLADELVVAFKTAGFAHVDLRGDLQFAPFDPDHSDALVLVARRAAP